MEAPDERKVPDLNCSLGAAQLVRGEEREACDENEEEEYTDSQDENNGSDMEGEVTFEIPTWTCGDVPRDRNVWFCHHCTDGMLDQVYPTLLAINRRALAYASDPATAGVPKVCEVTIKFRMEGYVPQPGNRRMHWTPKLQDGEAQK
jgi:hypothetical protein